MAESRDLLYFLESLHTEATRKSYEYHLKTFWKWSGKDSESIKFLGRLEVTNLLCDYALYQKKRVSPNSLLSYFGAIFKYLEISDVEFNRKKVVSLFSQKVKLRGYRPITDQELNEMIKVCSSDLERALVHVFSATGHRPEAFADLMMKDVEEIGDGCLSLRIYVDSRDHEADIFLHRFASDSLKRYHAWRESNGEKFTSGSYAFVGGRKFATMPIRSMTSSTISKIIARIIKRAKIKREKHGTNRFDLAVCGGFRKRFDTILKGNPNIPDSYVEKLLDHKNKLEAHYFKPTREQLFEQYKKAIPELIFDESEKIRIESENKQKKIDELESTKERVIRLESSIKHIQDLLEHESSMTDTSKSLKKIRDI